MQFVQTYIFNKRLKVLIDKSYDRKWDSGKWFGSMFFVRSEWYRSPWHTTPTWQFRLEGLLREHKFTYLLTYLLTYVKRIRWPACTVVLCDTHDTSILIVDTYVTIPVSPRSRYTAVYRSSTKYRETAQVSRVSSIPCSQSRPYHSIGLGQASVTSLSPLPPSTLSLLFSFPFRPPLYPLLSPFPSFPFLFPSLLLPQNLAEGAG